MRKIKIRTWLASLSMVIAASLAWAPSVIAKSSYGGWVDGACQQYNGTAPYAEQSCALCHTSPLSARVEPAWTWWELQTLTNFCLDVANAPPNGSIDRPAANVSITAGEAVSFAGSATDPDGDTQLTFRWNFGGAAADSTGSNPGQVVFNTPGTFNVTLTVSDSVGASDPTPASRTVRVAEQPVPCTDADGDGFSVEGGSCGLVDCDDTLAAVNPGALESCTDNIDNDCNGLVDANDPVAVACPAATSCTDRDGDGFYAEGGVCGPVDCDDTSPATTVECLQDEACRAENRCLQELFAPADPPGPVVLQARWRGRARTLVVEGSGFAPDTTVSIFNAGSGAALAGPGIPVSEDGEFSRRLSEPTSIPCSVRVAVDGSNFSADARVARAPRDCDDGSPSVAVVISRADWDDDARALLVEGRDAPPGAVVVLRSANDPDLVLGAASVAGDGDWSFRLPRPVIVPCRVRAQIDDVAAERNVNDAPDDCDSDPAPPPSALSIERADWDAGDRVLEVVGRNAPSGATVILRSADGLAPVLGQTKAEDDGRWKLEIEKPSAVPCRVRAEAGDRTAESDVDDAPGDCDADPAPLPQPSPLSIRRADWDADDRVLEVSGGNAPSGSTVTLRSADDPALVLGQAKVEDDGRWKLEIEKPSAVPCRIRAEAGGRTGESDVDGAPGNC